MGLLTLFSSIIAIIALRCRRQFNKWRVWFKNIHCMKNVAPTILLQNDCWHEYKIHYGRTSRNHFNTKWIYSFMEQTPSKYISKLAIANHNQPANSGCTLAQTVSLCCGQRQKQRWDGISCSFFLGHLVHCSPRRNMIPSWSRFLCLIQLQTKCTLERARAVQPLPL